MGWECGEGACCEVGEMGEGVGGESVREVG